LSSMRKLSARQILVAVMLIVVLLTIGVLTGRREIFVMIAIFMSTYLSLLLLFGKGGLKLALSIFLGGLLTYGLVTFWIVEQPYDIPQPGTVAYQHYAERTATVGSDISQRFLDLGLDPIQWALEDFGWLGGGLGIASQGAQHFGGGAQIF